MKTGLQAEGLDTATPVPPQFSLRRRTALRLFASRLAAADIAKEAPYWQNVLPSLYGYTAGRVDCFTTLDANTNYLRACNGHGATNRPLSRIRAIVPSAELKKKGRAH